MYLFQKLQYFAINNSVLILISHFCQHIGSFSLIIALLLPTPCSFSLTHTQGINLFQDPSPLSQPLQTMALLFMPEHLLQAGAYS